MQRNLPLLAEGLASITTAIGNPTIVQGKFTTNRGNVIGLDFVHTQVKGAANAGLLTARINALEMYDNQPLSAFAIDVLPGCYKPLSLNVRPESQYQFTTVGSAASTTVYPVAYHANPFDRGNIYSVNAAVYQAQTYNLRRFGVIASGNGAALSSGPIYVPQDKGPVQGIEITVYAGGNASIGTFVTLKIDGVEVIDTVNGAFFDSVYCRRKFFNLEVQAGSVIELSAVNATGTIVDVCANLYFNLP